jgi:ribosomal protein S18 acetylase RimI-like enzyme
MATIAARMAEIDLPTVRRFEAAGFRAWPAQTSFYDGTWSVRLTPDMTGRRLNSINPLDLSDGRDIERRVGLLKACFAEAGRPVTFRISPLASPQLVGHLDRAGWSVITPSLVMKADLAGLKTAEGDGVEEISAERFIDAAIALDNLEPANAEGFGRLIDRIQPQVTLFHIAIDGVPAANAICVRDGQVAGLFEVATAREFRGRGLGRKIVAAALDRARAQGASTGWLQVEAGNKAALDLYGSLGFVTIYPYHYRGQLETTT